ncbi:MAG: hypothetical protein IH851_05625 [Armatimonadetes bacterium]|nr:hypothetical protein [Armatimonadota bacterium]
MTYLVIVLILLGCAAGQVPTQDTLEELLARAKAQGLVTSVEEISASYQKSERNSAPVYVAIGRGDYRGEGSMADTFIMWDFLRGEVPLTDANAALERVNGLVKKMEGAASLPDYMPERDWENPIAMHFPELSAMREAARVLTSRAAIRAAQDDWAGAMSDMSLVANVVRHARNDRAGILAALVQRGTLIMWARGLEYLASRSIQDADACKMLVDVAATVQEPKMKAAIGYELAFMRQTILQMKRGEFGASELITAGSDEGQRKDEAIDRLFLERAESAEALLVGYYVRVAEAWGDVDRVRQISEEFERRLEDHGGDPAIGVAMVLAPMLDQYHKLALDAVANYRAARIGVIAAYVRAKTGKWPSLSEAAKEAGVSADDPFTSGNLAYKPSAAALLIYSVGPNGKDEGGVRRSQENRSNYDVAMFRVNLPSTPAP